MDVRRGSGGGGRGSVLHRLNTSRRATIGDIRRHKDCKEDDSSKHTKWSIRDMELVRNKLV